MEKRTETVTICMTWYYPKNSTKWLLEIINKFSKREGYKFNIQKSVAFYTLIANHQKENFLLKNLVYNCIKKNKIPRNKFNQGGERTVHWKLLNIDERNWKKHK